MSGAELFGELFRIGAFLGRQTRRDGGQRGRPVAECSDRLGQQIAGVDAAGEADDDAVQTREQIAQPRDLVVQTRHRMNPGRFKAQFQPNTVV